MGKSRWAKLYGHLTSDPTHRASDGIVGLAGQEAAADAVAARFVAWFRRLVDQPPADGGDIASKTSSPAPARGEGRGP